MIRKLPFLFLAAGLLLAIAHAEPSLPTVHFQTRDISGHRYSATDGSAAATVWVFIAHDCPISNEYAPLLHRLSKAFDPKQVQWRLVYAEPDLPLADLKAHAKAYALTSPAFADPGLKVTQACGIAVTPEVAVIDAQGVLVYRGRIDDRYADLSHVRPEAEVHDLHDAIEATLQGRPVARPRTQATGCVVELPPGAATAIVP